jgi:regulatory protein
LERKGYPPDLTSQTVDALRRSRYAGDASFAREWARSRADGKAYGPRRIEEELRAKGVDNRIILDALCDTFGANDEYQRAARALAKQFSATPLDEPKTRRRAAAFLQRRGYSEAVIHRLLTLEED